MILKDLKDIENKEDKLKFLKENKTAILKAKKAMTKEADSVVSYYSKNVISDKAEDNGNEVFKIVGKVVKCGCPECPYKNDKDCKEEIVSFREENRRWVELRPISRR